MSRTTGRAARPDGYPHHTVATRAYERIASRVEETASLLGSNLELPALGREFAEQDTDNNTIISATEHVENIQAQFAPRASSTDRDGLRDALSPVRETRRR